jgi:hypothetical protein
MAISQDERLNVRRRLFNIYLHFGHNFERKDMESLVENVRHEEILSFAIQCIIPILVSIFTQLVS